MKAKILVAEDDVRLNSIFVSVLKDMFGEKDLGADVEVLSVDNGLDALKTIQKENVVVAILDIMMPKLTGLEVSTVAKKEKDNLAVLIVTARHHSEIEAIDAKADAYMEKPINMVLFKKQVLALYEKMMEVPQFVYPINDVVKYDALEHVLNIGDEQVLLNHSYHELLMILLKHLGEPVSLEEYFPDRNMKSLIVLVNRLKAKFGEFKPLIQSAQGGRYVLSSSLPKE